MNIFKGSLWLLLNQEKTSMGQSRSQGTCPEAAVIIQVRDYDACDGAAEKWSDSAYIWKIEPRLADGLDEDV